MARRYDTGVIARLDRATQYAAARLAMRRWSTGSPAFAGDDSCGVAGSSYYLIGGAYWMPPLLHSEFSPRGIFSFDPSPTLRS